MKQVNPDILCLQEIKVETSKFPHEIFDGYGFEYRHIHGQKGYHGVAILSKFPLVEKQQRFATGNEEHRHIFAKLPTNIELHNLYIPAGGDTPDPESNLKFKSKLAMIDELADYYGKLNCENKILVGDFNIAPLPNDVWSHKQLLKVVSHTPIEVEKLEKWRQSGGFIDGVREKMGPDQKLYSWWSYRSKDWSASDRGRRLDHIWLGQGLANRVKSADILRAARGWENPSDHVPVTIELESTGIR